jgi:predicted AAA+ superfamily ATPase
VVNYLRFLGDTLLLRLIEPLEIRLKKRRAPPKLCLADHALRASWLQEIVPIAPRQLEAAPHLTTLAGHVAESVTGAALTTIHHLDLAHLPARPDQPEVDFVLTIGTHRIPLEVKYHRRIDPLRDTEGLRAFVERSVNNAPFGVLVTQSDDATVVDPRIVSLPLSSLLLMR